MSEQRISTRARVLAIPVVGVAAIGAALFSRTEAQTTPAATASPSPGASPAASPMASGAAATAVTFMAGDLFFDPKEATIAANTDVQVTLNNGGALGHDWAVQDHSDLQTNILDPGASQTITVNLPAGTYQFLCTVPGHAEAGMVGTLTVQ